MLNPLTRRNERYPTRPYAPIWYGVIRLGNAPAGDYAELLVQRATDGELAPNWWTLVDAAWTPNSATDVSKDNETIG